MQNSIKNRRKRKKHINHIGGKRPRRTIFTQKTIINQSKCKIQSKIAAKGRSIDSKSIKNRRKSKKHRLKTGDKSVVEKSMAGTIFNSDSRVAQEACIKPYRISCHILLYIKYHISFLSYIISYHIIYHIYHICVLVHDHTVYRII